MNRRELLIAATAGGAAAMMPSTLRAAPPPAGDDAYGAIGYEHMMATLADDPQYATRIGLDKGVHAGLRHRLNDLGPDARARERARNDRFVARVTALDPRTMSREAARHRELFLDDQRLRAAAERRFGIVNPEWPFVITHQSGAYLTIPEFLNTAHPIRTAGDAAAYLDRVRAFGTVLDQQSAWLESEAARGYLAPGFVLDIALAQIATFRTPAGRDSRLTRSLVRRTAAIPGDWGDRCGAIVEAAVYPALDRQIAAIRRLRTGARSSAGVWDVPDGEALYAAALERATTIRTDPAELHRIGIDQIATIGAQLEPLLVAQGLTRGSTGERLTALSQRPDLLYPDTGAGRAEMLRDAAALNDAMRGRLGGLFRGPPVPPLVVEPMTAEIEAGANDGNYYPASPDGSTPGRFRINLGALAGSPRFAMAAFAYHEGLPGHHLQKSCAMRTSSHRFTAYAEGWALYAEALADELGGYATPLDRIGYLQSRLFRAVRIVVDTGIHALRWTREQATDHLAGAAGLRPALARREIDRYCIRPGQACSYMVGYLAWQRAAATARRILGPRYDVKAFHEILQEGEVPLPMLQRLVEERARAQV